MNPQPLKFVYAHTPARYIWEPQLDQRGKGILPLVFSTILKPLDRSRSKEAFSIVANSKFTAARILRTWERESEVIYPPVQVKEIQSVSFWGDMITDSMESKKLELLPDRFILGASRFVSYKKLDDAIRVGEATDIPVVIAGAGPDEKRLRFLAASSSVPVYFIINPSNVLLRELYSRALVFVFASIEDFGIMPVEAMSVGTPVLSCGLGGVAETVLPDVSGAYFHSTEPGELRRSFEEALLCSPEGIKKHALQFDSASFQKKIKQWISQGFDGR